MKNVLLLGLVFLLACSDEVEPCPEVQTDYASELIESIQNSNERFYDNLGYTYVHFDEAKALSVATGYVANIDTVVDRAHTLKDYCFEFRKNLDSEVSYSSFEVETFYSMVEEFKEKTTSLSVPQFYQEDHFTIIDSILNFNSIEHLGDLSENQFRIEIELYKQRFLEVEFLTAECLLSELEYTQKMDN